MSSGSHSYLDFHLSCLEPGLHSLEIHHDDAGPVPLALGLSVDRTHFRTVVYPAAAGCARRTTTIQLWIHRRMAVIRLAEGRPGAWIRITGIDLHPVPAS